MLQIRKEDFATFVEKKAQIVHKKYNIKYFQDIVKKRNKNLR
jgi:hypothetical protein